MRLVTIILNTKVMLIKKTLSIKEYVEELRQHLKDINNLKISDTWKVQSTIAIDFMPFKDADEKRVMHSKSDNKEIMVGKETDEIIKELSESLFSGYQKGLEESMKGSDVAFGCANLSYYK